MVIKDIDH